jgi:hypothetical protein
MKALRTYLLLGLPLGVGACAPQVPIPEAFPPTLQEKVQSAHHWDVLAERVAVRLHDALGDRDSKGQPLVLHINKPREDTVFNRAFHELLTTQLMQQGFGISLEPNVGWPVTYEVQVITHKDRGLGSQPTSTGTWQQREAGFNDRSPPRPTTLPLSSQGDYAAQKDSDFIYYAAGSVPNNEIIVTTYIQGSQRFVTRMSDVYYVNDNNRDQYFVRARDTTRRMEVVGQ